MNKRVLRNRGTEIFLISTVHKTTAAFTNLFFCNIFNVVITAFIVIKKDFERDMPGTNIYLTQNLCFFFSFTGNLSSFIVYMCGIVNKNKQTNKLASHETAPKKNIKL